MNELDINAKIAVKQKEVSVEKDPNKKARLQNELQILIFRKQIEDIKVKIKRLK